MNFFNRLFKRNPIPEIELGILNTDVHSHFLPGIDDGAKTIEDSLIMLEKMQGFGYNKVITTPHVMSDCYNNSSETIISVLENLRREVKNAGLTISIDAAAEYYLDYEFEKKIATEKLLTFGDNYLLFEISYLHPPDSINKIIFDLQIAGYKPVLAHPERYPFWFDQFETYHDMLDRGVLLQLNIASLTDHYSPATRKIAQRMIDENMIAFLGTDCHHLGHIELFGTLKKNAYLHKLINSGKLRNQSL